jgi:hypothetical protein
MKNVIQIFLLSLILLLGGNSIGSQDGDPDQMCDCYTRHGIVWLTCDLHCQDQGSRCKAVYNSGQGCLGEDCCIYWMMTCEDYIYTFEFFCEPCIEDCGSLVE